MRCWRRLCSGSWRSCPWTLSLGKWNSSSGSRVSFRASSATLPQLPVGRHFDQCEEENLQVLLPWRCRSIHGSLRSGLINKVYRYTLCFSDHFFLFALHFLKIGRDQQNHFKIATTNRWIHWFSRPSSGFLMLWPAPFNVHKMFRGFVWSGFVSSACLFQRFA